jgi:hypothetical protein
MLKGMICAALLVMTAAPLAQAKTVSEFYEDAYTFFGRPNGIEGGMTVDEYDAATRSLATQFSAICGDTFCSGDYSNIQPLSLDCSVGHNTGAVADCVWTFGASTTSIDPTSGALTVSKQVFECHLGVKGSAAELSTFLRTAASARPGRADGLRQAVVPGTSKALLSVLGECL